MPYFNDGNAARDMFTGGTGDVTITDASGNSLVGQPLNSETMWQQWNITFTTGAGTTTVQAYPRSVAHDLTATGTSTAMTWEVWNGDYGSTTLTGSITDNVISLDRAVTTSHRNVISTVGTGRIDRIETVSTHTWTNWSQQFPADQVRRAPYGFVRMSREEREVWEQREREVAAERAEERQGYEARIAEERALREGAEKRAEELLLRHLNPEQQAEYKRSKRFYLYTGGKKYRIDKGWQGNVKLVDETDEKKVLASYCIHPFKRIPECDNMLAQKLLLEGSEAEFKRIANESRYRY